MKIVKTTFNLFSQSFLKIFDAVRQSRSLKEIVTDSFKKLKSSFAELTVKFKDLKKANFDLGKFHYYNGSLGDAKVRFHVIKFIFKSPPKEIDYFLARSYFEQGKVSKAIKYVDLYLKSGDKAFRAEAILTKKIIDDTATNIEGIPDSMVTREFDLLAPIYNEIYINDNHSCIQNFILQEIKKTLSDLGCPFGNKMLDLGCGTGYIGRKLKESKAISSATGIDLSPKMLQIASKLRADDLKVYDTTLNINALSYLNDTKTDNDYDIIIASQFFNYVHNLNETVNLFLNKLNKGGVCIFTFKVFGDKSGVYFDRFTETFLHSGDEIMTKLKNNNNCSIIVSKPLSFEYENDTGLIILKRK